MKFYCLVDGEKIIQIQNKKNNSFLEIELDEMEDYVNYKYNGTNFVKIEEEEKKKLYPFLYEEPAKPITLEERIASTLNTMVLNVIPDGESLTKENAPTLVDIIKPENQGDKPEAGNLGDINNPIEVVGNVMTDGFLYTYGLYYSYGGKKYKCERGGAPATQGSIKLYYTPDQLIGHYFVTV